MRLTSVGMESTKRVRNQLRVTKDTSIPQFSKCVCNRGNFSDNKSFINSCIYGVWVWLWLPVRGVAYLVSLHTQQVRSVVQIGQKFLSNAHHVPAQNSVSEGWVGLGVELVSVGWGWG